ncbi:MAG: LysE family translocator, partial [Opitutaceae bacterium]|nr:LysE family translocator [Opitutaceae bacterium]
MLTLEQAAAFLPAAFLLTLAPGPDILMTVSLGLARGRQAAVGFGLGCVTGCVTHTLLTAFGVGALMLASPRAFFVLKCAGAVYLLWLAWKLLAPGRQAAADKPPPEDRFYARGILSSSLNPKVIIFYCAFFPQFVRPGHPAPPQL